MAGECIRQVKNVTNLLKRATFWNLITKFEITMRPAFKSNTHIMSSFGLEIRFIDLDF